MKKAGILGVLVLSLLWQPMLPVSAQNNGKEAVQELVTLFSAWPDEQGRKSISAAAARHIDYPGMAELAFTRAQWDQFSPDQKRQLSEAFRKFIETHYYKRWHRLFLRAHLTIANEAKAGGATYVRTYLAEGNDEDEVIWRLQPRNGELMVVDLSVNGRDLISRLSDRLQKQLKKRGTQGLVAWMKEASGNAAEAEDDVSLRKSASK